MDELTNKLFVLLYNAVMYMEEQGESDDFIMDYLGIDKEQLDAIETQSIDDFPLDE